MTNVRTCLCRSTQISTTQSKTPLRQKVKSAIGSGALERFFAKRVSKNEAENSSLYSAHTHTKIQNTVGRRVNTVVKSPIEASPVCSCAADTMTNENDGEARRCSFKWRHKSVCRARLFRFVVPNWLSGAEDIFYLSLSPSLSLLLSLAGAEGAPPFKLSERTHWRVCEDRVFTLPRCCSSSRESIDRQTKDRNNSRATYHNYPAGVRDANKA